MSNNKVIVAFIQMLEKSHPEDKIISHTNSADLDAITAQMEDSDILITNNNWREDKCDFQIYDKSTKLLLWVDEEGNTLNDFTENELLENTEIEDKIKPLIKRAYTSSAICVVC